MPSWRRSERHREMRLQVPCDSLALSRCLEQDAGRRPAAEESAQRVPLGSNALLWYSPVSVSTQSWVETLCTSMPIFSVAGLHCAALTAFVVPVGLYKGRGHGDCLASADIEDVIRARSR